MLHNLSFSAFARGCGGHGVKVTIAEQLDEMIAEAITHNGPVMVEIILDAELIKEMAQSPESEQ